MYQQGLFTGYLSIPLPLARQADHVSILLQLSLVVMHVLTYVLRWRVSPAALGAPNLQTCTTALGTPGPWLQMSTCQVTTQDGWSFPGLDTHSPQPLHLSGGVVLVIQACFLEPILPELGKA